MSNLNLNSVTSLDTGREVDVNRVMQTVDYVGGLVIDSRDTVVVDGDDRYVLAASTVLPYTTTGSGMLEGGAFVSVGDAVLRQDLAAPGGAGLVGNGGIVFDSVAAMKSSTWLTVGQKVRTLGYYTPGDGGGNDYEIVAPGAGVDDGGSFIDLSGSGLQAKGLFVDGIANIKQFGAVGDGVTDDRTYIQSALDYISESQSNTTIHIPVAPSGCYAIKSEHPNFPGHGLVYTHQSVYSNQFSVRGEGPRSTIKLDTPTEITSLLYFSTPTNFCNISGLHLEASELAGYVFKADEHYHPFTVMQHCRFSTPVRSGTCLAYSSFMSNFSNVITFNGSVGFKFHGIGGGPVTSLTINSCYALQAQDTGFDIGYATYSTLNSCACDGKASHPTLHTKHAYKIANAYGVTLNACGSEQTQRFLKVNSYRGLTINSAFMLTAGGVSSPVDYLIELVGGLNASISGFRIESVLAGGYTYKLGQTGNLYGSENITVLDNSITRSDSFWVPNFNFDRPIKFIRGDETVKDISTNISTTNGLLSALSKEYSFRDIKHGITLNLSDGVYDLSGDYLTIANSIGSGTLTLQGNASDRTLVKIDCGQGSRLRIENSKITLKDITLGSSVPDINAIRLTCVNSDVTLDNVNITRDGVNSGMGVRALEGSNVKLINGTEVSGLFHITPWKVDEDSSIEIEVRSAHPTTGRWSQGMKFYYENPVASGHIGAVCVVAGEPGIWKDFGAISS